MNSYIALIHRGESGSWGISFPDFPGCVSAADSFEDVMAQGAAALRFHVEGMLEDGDAIPVARSLEALQTDPEFAEDFEGATVALLPLLPPRDTPMRVNVVLDSNLLARIDETADQLGLNRSEFLAESARWLILNPEKAKPRNDLSAVKAKPRAAGTELSEFVTRSVFDVERTRLSGRDARTGQLVTPTKKAARSKEPSGKKRG
jgi:predicted RNase H-like HicB family nuclease